MTENSSGFSIIEQQHGNTVFKILSFDDVSYFNNVQRSNYHSLIWITDGSGKAKIDFTTHEFTKNSLFAFSPHQPFTFLANEMKGIAILFHPDFFCIHKHQTETACLFNNFYQLPYTIIDEASAVILHRLIDQMKSELTNIEHDQHEIIVSYLKIVLITIARLKTRQEYRAPIERDHKESFILQALKDAIERDFRKKHSAGAYAETLNISTKALSRITKNHFGRTPTELISERIVIEAKRELYLTKKSIKEIAYELGYEDVHYFSRFFKNSTSISPQIYRDSVGFERLSA